MNLYAASRSKLSEQIAKKLEDPEKNKQNILGLLNKAFDKSDSSRLGGANLKKDLGKNYTYFLANILVDVCKCEPDPKPDPMTTKLGKKYLFTS